MYLAPSNPNLINNPAAGLPGGFPQAMPASISPNPVSIPIPDPTMNVPSGVAAPPVLQPNVESFSGNPPILPGAPPALPVAYPSTLPNPAPPAPGSSWLDQQMLKGVPNKYLLIGLLGIFAIAAAGTKEKR